MALLTDGYGARGGIARYNQDLMESLADGGAKIFVLPRLGDISGLTLPSGIEQAPPTLDRLGYFLRTLWSAWRRGPFDVVFCGHLYMAVLGCLIARLLGARLWLQAHGTEALEAPGRLTRRAVEAADLVTAVSRATRRALLGWANLAPERVRVLPDTVRDVFVPGLPSEALRTRLGLGPGPILLTVSRLAARERYKGHEQIFAVLPALRTEFPSLVHVVAGDGDDRARLEARALELAGDRAAVRFIGFVSEEDLPDLYRTADLYVMPSAKEGFGIVYLEAAACGLRVIGGRGGGTADAIIEQIGMRVDPNDSAALAYSIRKMLAKGRGDAAAVEPYRRKTFATAARRLLARLTGCQYRRGGAV